MSGLQTIQRQNESQQDNETIEFRLWDGMKLDV